MNVLTECQARERAQKYLDSEQVKNPCEEVAKADELVQFWKWNPPAFAEGQPCHWNEWNIFQRIDPEAGEDGIHKMSVDMARYFVERSETDRDYWDALRKILAKMLSASDSSIRRSASDDPNLCGWLVDFLEGRRTPPNKQRGNKARKYHARDGCIYFAIQALCEQGQMNQSAAIEWVGKRINLSSEAVASIYRKARMPG